MSLKKLVQDTAAESARDEIAPTIAKLINMITTKSTGNFGTIVRINSPNEFVVNVNGKEKTVTYLGDRAVGKGSELILESNDQFGR